MAPRWIFGIVLGAVVAGAFYVPGLGGDARDVSKDMLRREAEVNEDEVSKDMLRREAEVNEDETSKDMLRREPGFRDVEVDESLKEKKKDKADYSKFKQLSADEQLRIMRELTNIITSPARKQRIMNEYELTAEYATLWMAQYNRQYNEQRLIQHLSEIKTIINGINLTHDGIKEAMTTMSAAAAADMTMMNATLDYALAYLKQLKSETKQQ